MARTDVIDRYIESEGFDGFLIRADSSDPNFYYLTRFEAPDPMTYLRTGKESILLAPPMEYSRAKEESDADKVLKTDEFKDANTGNHNSRIELIQRFLERYDIKSLAVPPKFPLKTAEELREKDIQISTTQDKVAESRRIKSEQETEKLRESQQITEKAMEKARSMVENADVRCGELYQEDDPLTSERMRREIKYFLLEQGCEVPEETIVASGKESAKPHSTGKGILEAGEPIIVDIFPRHRKYFGDMTRTFVKGEASEEVKEMREAVLDAQKAAFGLLEKGAGINAGEIHQKVCDVLENHGYNSLRENGGDSGFIHSTGHGVGLELHEQPGISDKEEKIRAGMVLTIEPGLYLPEIGGVRLEDMVKVQDGGYENFNDMGKKF